MRAFARRIVLAVAASPFAFPRRPRRRLAMIIATLALALGGTFTATASPASAALLCSGGYPPGLTTNSSAYLVGMATEYQASGPANCPIYWSSWKYESGVGWVSTGEVGDFYGQFTDSNGFFEQYGNPWGPSDVGQWIKQAAFGSPNGPTASVYFQVLSN